MSIQLLNQVKQPWKAFDFFSIICRHNPRFPVKYRDHFDYYLRFNSQNGKVSNQIIMRIKDNNDIKMRYLNYENDIVFNINYFETTHLLNALKLPDEITINSPNGLDNASLEKLREFSRMLHPALAGANMPLFVNKNDPKKLALVFISSREWLNTFSFEQDTTRPVTSETVRFTQANEIGMGEREGSITVPLDKSPMMSMASFSTLNDNEVKAKNRFTKEGYGNLLKDYQTHTRSRCQYISRSKVGWMNNLTYGMLANLTSHVIWIKCV